ncbi:hypothetical protein DENSPDRAFT_853352 [Dentipellis sp. KUC8613]|nr:hypothetical protein DENSPDRAFT_853352 [Dentipellis sp. KUC8613]
MSRPQSLLAVILMRASYSENPALGTYTCLFSAEFIRNSGNRNNRGVRRDGTIGSSGGPGNSGGAGDSGGAGSSRGPGSSGGPGTSGEGVSLGDLDFMVDYLCWKARRLDRQMMIVRSLIIALYLMAAVLIALCYGGEAIALGNARLRKIRAFVLQGFRELLRRFASK